MKSKRTILYNAAKVAKVGETIECCVCHQKFIKRQWSQAFCCIDCKDKYWNAKGDRHLDGYYKEYNANHPERLERVGINLDECCENWESAAFCEDLIEGR